MKGTRKILCRCGHAAHQGVCGRMVQGKYFDERCICHETSIHERRREQRRKATSSAYVNDETKPLRRVRPRRLVDRVKRVPK